MMALWRFHDRREAGRALGERLATVDLGRDPIVLALPRGGVPVGYEAARAIRAPLDVFVVRKLGLPGQEELAMGALASGGVRVLNQELVDMLDIPTSVIDAVSAAEAEELARRERAYRGQRPPPRLHDRTVILVDDGVATGSTMRAAIAALRRLGVERVVVAVPVGAGSTLAVLKEEADDVIALLAPEPFFAVGAWYEQFGQTTDDEVRTLLARSEEERPAHPPAAP